MSHICAYLSSFASQRGELASFKCGERSTTPAKVLKRVAALAVGLRQRLHAGVGDCVCLAALTTDHNIESLLAITAAGCIAAPLNWRWSGSEGAYAAQLVGAKLLLADAACLKFAASVAKACRNIEALVLLGDPGSYADVDLGIISAPIIFAEALISTCVTSSLDLRFAPGNAALVVFTSGTTGRPKGVLLTHNALHVQSLSKLLMVGYRSSDVYLHAAPLFHIGGISSALAMLMAGASHVFLPRFTPQGFLEEAREQGVTSFIAVPAMIAALVDSAGSSQPLRGVRTILLGGGGTPPALQQGLRSLFPCATVHTAYGMTEASSSMTFRTLWSPPPSPSLAAGGQHAQRAEDAQLRSWSPWTEADQAAREQPGKNSILEGSQPGGGAAGNGGPAGGVYVGCAPPGIELAIYHPPSAAAHAVQGPQHRPAGGGSGQCAGGKGRGTSRGRVVAEGEGELVTRGPHTMEGYWGDEGASQGSFLPGGWMRTGDLGHLSKGRLWLMGRAKDMIKSGGENVHAWEVERVLGEHPAVASVAVVGVPDWRLGEAVAAVLVLQPGWVWRGPACQTLLQSARTKTEVVSVAVTAAARSAKGAGEVGGVPGKPDAVGAKGGEGAGGASDVLDRLEGLEGLDPEGEGEGEGVRQAVGGELQRASCFVASGEGGPGLVEGYGGVAGVFGYRQQAAQQRMWRMADSLLRLSAQPGGDETSSGQESSSSASADDSPAIVDGRILQKHCRQVGLAGFKLPRVFVALPNGESLPTNSTGKVLKHVLKGRVDVEMRAAEKAGRSLAKL